MGDDEARRRTLRRRRCREVEVCRDDEPRPRFVDEVFDAVAFALDRAGDAEVQVFGYRREWAYGFAQGLDADVPEGFPVLPRHDAPPRGVLALVRLAHP